MLIKTGTDSPLASQTVAVAHPSLSISHTQYTVFYQVHF